MASAALDHGVVEGLRRAALPLRGGERDYDALLDLIGDAHYVLLGEASHGTHEFYRERALITRRLIEERGFTAVVAEADWPDAYRVNCYVLGHSTVPNAETALGGFQRFPTWMWRNTVVRDWVEWLRARNGNVPEREQAGFYGMDLYSLSGSIRAVLEYLDRVDPAAAARARARYACFEQFGEDSQAYGYAATLGITPRCEAEVVKQLQDLYRHAPEYARRDGNIAEDEQFFAEQNARVVMGAEEYYRSMFRGRVSSWNLRDQHMAETVERLTEHLERRAGRAPRMVLWAHNSHLGDARATDMGEMGEMNVGQLIRERYGRDAVLIGFTTYTGTVTAASDWDGPTHRKRVRNALPDSYEALFHELELPRFMLPIRHDPAVQGLLRAPRLERAIGVIYRPETERLSHYFHARMADQFDALLHFEHSRALEPLDRGPHWIAAQEAAEEAPETYPTGL